MAKAEPSSTSAKVFMSGRSQAVRLPKDFRFDCEEVAIRKVGDSLVLCPRYASWEDFWANTEPLDDDVVKAVLARNNDLPREDPERASFD